MEFVSLFANTSILSSPSMHCSALTTDHIASGFENSSIHVWPLSPPDRTATRGSAHPHSPPAQDDAARHIALCGHQGPVYGTSFSAGGRYLVSGGEDGCVRLWDVHRGTCVVCYKGHVYPVWDLVFRWVCGEGGRGSGSLHTTPSP